MENLVNVCRQEAWPARVAAVISNDPQAKGLVRAAQFGIPTAVVDHRVFSDRANFESALIAQIDQFAPDLVVLAGFMRVLGSAFVGHYEGRMFNIHPSLLPSFPGLHTHRRALEAGVKLHGATVHFVTAELDHGPIVVQAAVPVYADDDEKTLAARVLEQEHQIYPRAVRWFIDDRLQQQGERVILIPPEPQGFMA